MKAEDSTSIRPSTVGELKDLLSRGVTCEVASSGREITKIKLNGWLQFYWFTTRPSGNDRWTLFEPTKEGGGTT